MIQFKGYSIYRPYFLDTIYKVYSKIAPGFILDDNYVMKKMKTPGKRDIQYNMQNNFEQK